MVSPAAWLRPGSVADRQQQSRRGSDRRACEALEFSWYRSLPCDSWMSCSVSGKLAKSI